jgi:enterochelin esterase-like enzyme
MKPARLALALLSVSSTSLAQPVPPGGQPAPKPAAPAPARQRPRVVSPEVAADRRVTFRIAAPEAHAVSVSGQFAKDRVALVRDGQGVWSATVGPVEPGLYEYGFTVDGLRLLDPVNPRFKPQRTLTTSTLEVPATPPAMTEYQDVPHGTIHVHEYHARALGRLRRVHVYTPPDYERNARARSPTLYLLHGSGDNDACWSTHGRAPYILDNLIAQKKAVPMVVVMPDGHPVLEQNAPPGENTRAFERDLLEEVMPLVEGRYRLKTDAASRAIAGLSMGGDQSVTTGFGHPDKFAWIGAFSSAAQLKQLQEGALADAGAAKGLAKKLRWLWIGCGKEDALLARNEELVAWLKANGVPHTWHVSEGGHAWPVWRQYLAEVAPQLFRKR